MATLRQLIESALTTQGISGAIPKEIRAALVEQSRLSNPLYALIPRFKVDTNKYWWVTRRGLPQGGASLEAPPLTGAGSVTESASNYGNSQAVNIRNMTWRGNISKIAEQVATKVGSVITNEMKGQAEAEHRTESVLNLYGSESATAASNHTQWTGMDSQVALTNKLNFAAGTISTLLLDDLIDLVRPKVGVNDLGGKWAFIMSHQMQTAINALYNNTNRTNLPVTTVAPRIDSDVFGEKDAAFYAQAVRALAGQTVAAYHDVPIIPSSFIQPTGTMGAVTTGAGGTTGTTFTATAQYYRVEGVTLLGKTVACAEVSYTPVAGGSVLLSWTPPVVTDYLAMAYPVLLYRVFRGATSGTETLYAIVAGSDVNDNPVTSFTDANAAIDPLTGGAGNAYVFAAPDGVTVPANTAKTEDIFLWPIDPEIAGMAVLNEMNQEQLAPTTSRSIQFETTADMALTVLTPAFAAQATNVTHA